MAQQYKSMNDGGAKAPSWPQSLRRINRRRALTLGAVGAGLAALPPLGLAGAAGGQQPPRGLSGDLSVIWFSYKPAAGIKIPQAMYKKYMQMHPGVTLTFPAEPSGDVGAQTAWLTTRAMANRLPDIYGPGGYGSVLDTVKNGWWVDLTPYLDKPNPYVPGNKRWRDLFLPGLEQQGAYYDGRNFLIEADGANNVFYINKTLFHKVGVEIPTTWVELMAVSERFRKAGYYAFTAPNSQGWPMLNLSAIIESSLWSKEFKRPSSTLTLSIAAFLGAVKRHKFSKTDPRTVAAWKLIHDWSQTWAPGTLTAPDDRAFLKGDVAIYYEGTYNQTSLLAAVGNKFEVDMMAIPTVTAASSPYADGDTAMGGSTFGGGNPVAVSTVAQRAGRLPLAIDFLQWYSTPGVCGPMAVEQGLVPGIMGADVGGALAKKGVDYYLKRPSLLAAATAQLPSEYYAQQQKLLTGYLAGAVDLPSALGQMQAVLEAVTEQIIVSAKLTV